MAFLLFSHHGEKGNDMAKTKSNSETRERRKRCRTQHTACVDPADIVFRNERVAFLEALLETAFLSGADKGFLLAYFDYGPGGSGVMDCTDFGITFGMGRGMVAFRLCLLLEELKRRVRILGYRKIDFC